MDSEVVCGDVSHRSDDLHQRANAGQRKRAYQQNGKQHAESDQAQGGQ